MDEEKKWKEDQEKMHTVVKDLTELMKKEGIYKLKLHDIEIEMDRNPAYRAATSVL